jgi:dTDP-4-amino-4,6-dideoxygalactose transaminase
MIPLFKVHIPKDLGNQIQRVFDEGIVTEGVYSDQFEKEISNLVGNQNCSLLNSGTSALTLAYRLSNVGPGDEVITTPMTCMATNEPIDTMGAKIVFADIDPTTGNIDPDSVKKKLSKKTKAVVGVHWAGQPYDIEGIHSVVKNFNPEIKVIEDAAHALGATYKNREIGSHSDFVCFSFQAIKHLTTVDGGAICSLKNEDDIRIKKLRWFGLDRKFTGSKWEQDILESGYKFHMNNVNAAIGLAQMRHIHQIIDEHKKNGKLYDQKIHDTKRVKKLRRDANSESSYWIYSILVDDVTNFKNYMSANEIATDAVHVRNDKYTVFKNYRTNDLHGTDEFCSKMINIPVGWWLSNEDKEKIIKVVN